MTSPDSTRFQRRFSPVSARRPTVLIPPGPGVSADYREEGAFMSRFRRALAGAAMAVAVAGGGMVAAAAGAAPAHAATTPTPAAVSHTFGFTIAPTAPAAGGIGPKFQCGETCGDPQPPAPSGPTIITCTLHIPDASIDAVTGFITFRADTTCDGTLPKISQTQL